MFQEPPEYWPALDRYHRRLAGLLDTPLQFSDSGYLEPTLLDLDDKAKAVWIEFYNTVEAELSLGGDMAETRDVASKAGDNAARLAALFQVFENGPIGKISADNMHRACQIVAWHLYEARRFLSQVSVPQAVTDALMLESWLAAFCRREDTAMVHCARIQRFGPNRIRRKEMLEAALKELEGAGRIRRTTDGRKAAIEVHPDIMGGNYGAS